MRIDLAKTRQVGLDDTTAILIRLLDHCRLPDGTSVLGEDWQIRPEAALACWLFNGEAAEYGNIEFDGQTRRAHRVAYKLLVAPLDRTMPLNHDCDAPGCCNVLHVSPGSHRENMQDRNERGRARGRNSTELTEKPVGWSEQDFLRFHGLD